MFARPRFIHDTSGNVAMIFALSIIPILAIAGFAIDFTMASTSKNRMQHIADSAVLAGSRAMQAGQKPADIELVMSSYIQALLVESGNASLRCSTPEYEFADGSQDIKVRLLCKQNTVLMGIVGTPTVLLGVEATSTWGVGKLDVAFMFDVSGSMASNNRMTDLKVAAKDAIDTLKPANGGPGTEDVRIAMISYNNIVNAGDEFSEVTGLAPSRTYFATDRYEEEVQEPYESTCRVRVKEYYNRCTRRRRGRCIRWSRRYRYVYENQACTKYRTVTLQKERTVSKTINSTCVWERNGTYAFTDEAPSYKRGAKPINEIYDATEPIYHADGTSDNPKAYLAAGYAYLVQDRPTVKDTQWEIDGTSCSKHKPVPLTDDRTKLINYVNGLSTGGGTAGHQGIAWSWYLVSDKWNQVFPGNQAPLDFDEPDSVKAVILMTDGAFNRVRFDDQGNSDQQARGICDAMKDQDKVLIYTIAFQAPTAGQNILNYCASGPEFAFSPENGEQLSQAYQAIATSISDLRIKH